MKKIISISLIFLISNYTISCYSTEQVASEDYWVGSSEKIVSVITKDGREILFYEDSAHYNPEERVITGNKLKHVVGTTSMPYRGEPIKVSLDELLWVKVERFELGRTISAAILIPAVIYGVYFLITLATGFLPASETKESCPFVYSYDGNGYTFDAEPYGGAISEVLKRTDYSRLEHLRNVNGRYKLMLRNEVRETQYTDEISIIVVDHPSGTTVIPNESGVMSVIKTPIKALRAIDKHGNDIGSFLDSTDGIAWLDMYSDMSVEKSRNLRQEIIAEFPKPEGINTVKLLVNAGTALWGSHMIRAMLELRGDKVDEWYTAINSGQPELFELMNFVEREELYVLKVHVKVGENWEVRGVIQGGGPFITEDRVISIDLTGVEGDNLMIKLEPPVAYWTIDYLAVQYSDMEPSSEQEIHLASAVDFKGNDVSILLSKTDGKYQILTNIGDWAELEFEAPVSNMDGERTLYLKTTGYYELQLPKDEPMQVELLTFLQETPGEILSYSYKEYLRWQKEEYPSLKLHK